MDPRKPSNSASIPCREVPCSPRSPRRRSRPRTDSFPWPSAALLVKSRPMLVASDQEDAAAIEDAKFSKRSVLLVIGKRSLPHLLEATFVPAILFWVFLTVLGAGAAMIAVFVWTSGAILRRVLRGQRIPGVLPARDDRLDRAHARSGSSPAAPSCTSCSRSRPQSCLSAVFLGFGAHRPAARRHTGRRLLPDRRRPLEPARCDATVLGPHGAVGRGAPRERGRHLRAPREPAGAARSSRSRPARASPSRSPACCSRSHGRSASPAGRTSCSRRVDVSELPVGCGRRATRGARDSGP